MRTNLLENTLPLIGDTIFSEIQRDLLHPISLSSLMAHNTFIHDWVEDGENDEWRISQYLSNIKHQHQALTAFFVSEKTRKYYYADGVLKMISEENERDSWYFRVKRMTEKYEINVDPDLANSDALTVFVNYQVRDKSGKFIGAIGIGLSLDSIKALLAEYSAVFNRVVYFADRNGDIKLNMWLHGSAKNLEEVEGLKNILPQVMSTTSESSFRYTNEGEQIFLNARYIEKLDWYLLVEEKESVSGKPFLKALLLNLFIGCVVAFAVLILARKLMAGYQRDLEHSATHDNLTNVLNRQSFETRCEALFNNQKRAEKSLSMMFLDIDHFKKINDTYGHQAGDTALCHVVDTLKESVGDLGTICRWGGEEFCVLLENSSEFETFAAAKKAREDINMTSVNIHGVSVSLTVSIGVAQRQGGETLEHFMRRIDAALYAAKGDGRDRVCKAANYVGNLPDVYLT